MPQFVSKVRKQECMCLSKIDESELLKGGVRMSRTRAEKWLDLSKEFIIGSASRGEHMDFDVQVRMLRSRFYSMLVMILEYRAIGDEYLFQHECALACLAARHAGYLRATL